LGAGEYELALTRFNRYGPLLSLSRLDEAQRVLESCVAVYREVGDLLMEAKALSALASLWYEWDDHKQAAGLERQALVILNRRADPTGRAISHGNLASYLNLFGLAGEATRHRLTAIVYDFGMGHGQSLARDLSNLAIDIRRAAASGKRYELPRLAELLARPEFEPLQRTLAEWNVALDELQAKIDEVVEEVRRGVEAEET